MATNGRRRFIPGLREEDARQYAAGLVEMLRRTRVESGSLFPHGSAEMRLPGVRRKTTEDL